MRHRLTRFLPFVGLVVAAAALWVLLRYAHDVHLSGVLRHLSEYSWQQVLPAIGFSFLALALNGLYEARALREAGHPLGVARPMLVAAIVYPIGHSVGLSTLSAGALRYRLYTPLGLPYTSVAAMIFYTVLPYVLGLGLLLELALILDPGHAATALHLGVGTVLVLGVAGLAKDVIYGLLTALRKQPITIGPFAFRLPSPRFTLLQYVLGSVEIMCVASVLYLFLPAEVHLAFPAFLAVYLLSIIAGNLSSVPAGLGVVEAALLLLLRDLPREQLIAAVVAYRAVFEVLPLLLALCLLALYEFGSRHGFAGRLWRKPSLSLPANK